MPKTDTLRPPNTRHWRAACAALVAIFFLAACGGSSDPESAKDQGDNGVASVTDGDKDAKATQPQQSQDVRPLIRPDTSDEESDRVFNVYYECLQRNGVKMLKQGDRLKPIDTGRKTEGARKKCWQKEPEYLTERAAREDPEFHEKMDRWVNCLRDHGIKAIALDDGTLNLPDNLPPYPQSQWLDKCELKAFVAK
ncbi:hypothetical protein [Streptomyces sp. NPDC005209]|uniref:hypothetical protein n=1 Tax=Streptomyces sp. NPDC005209 TaxID=3156715 RepID=UPI0033B519F1